VVERSERVSIDICLLCIAAAFLMVIYILFGGPAAMLHVVLCMLYSLQNCEW